MSNAAYSSIQHLAHALFLNHDPKRVLMIMLTAYFDASASQEGTPVMTIAGFASTEEKWLRFESEWNSVLHKYEVSYLHMKEFTSSTKVFTSWKGQEERRKAFLIELLKVAKRGIYKGASCSMRIDDFEAVNRDFRLREHWGSEYSFLGMNVVSALMNWKKKRFPHAPIKYIFEDGDPGQGDLRKCLQQEQLPYSFIPKKENQNGTIKYIVPFQLADFAAWEQRAAFARFHAGHYDRGEPEDPLLLLRQSFQAMYEQLPAEWSVITNEGLRGLCNSKNLLRIATASSLSPDVGNHQVSHS